LTFAASANCVVYRGATPVFVDVDPSTLLMDPERVLGLVTEKTRAVIAVDYAGQPCDYSGLRARIGALQIPIVADACHALGASSGDGTVGSIADISTFSFHPAKHITTGEGGMVTTDDHRLAQRIRQFRNHGITTDLHQREKSGSTTYDMVELGFNYRLTDFQCAMGLSQLERLDTIIEHRRDIARHYDAALSTISEIEPVGRRPATDHSYHLYVIRFPETSSGIRDDLARALRAEGIGTAVHYPPVHLHPFYRRHLNLRPGLCPNAERAAGEILSLPMHSAMGRDDADDVIEALVKVSKGILGQ
jgi:perosamine synthetase